MTKSSTQARSLKTFLAALCLFALLDNVNPLSLSTNSLSSGAKPNTKVKCSLSMSSSALEQSTLAENSPEEEPAPLTANSSTTSLDHILPQSSHKKKYKRDLPDWGKSINTLFGVPLITHADRLHIHAGAGLTWFLGAYTLLATGFFQEVTLGSMEVFEILSPAHHVVFTAGIVMAITAFPMFPGQKQFRMYKSQMRHAMSSVAILISTMYTFMLPDATLYPFTVALSHCTGGLGMALLVYDGVVDRRPWDVMPIIEEMKLTLEYNRVTVAALYAVSIGWVILASIAVSHVAGGDSEHLTNLASDPATKAFATQMALSLAVTPATDALIAGTIMKNERFLKNDGQRSLLTGDAANGVRPLFWIEVLQLCFTWPGPAVLTIAATLLLGHTDAIGEFFYLDALQNLHSS